MCSILLYYQNWSIVIQWYIFQHRSFRLNQSFKLPSWYTVINDRQGKILCLLQSIRVWHYIVDKTYMMQLLAYNPHGVYDLPDSKVHWANSGPIWGRQDWIGKTPACFSVWQNPFRWPFMQGLSNCVPIFPSLNPAYQKQSHNCHNAIWIPLTFVSVFNNWNSPCVPMSTMVQGSFTFLKSL